MKRIDPLKIEAAADLIGCASVMWGDNERTAACRSLELIRHTFLLCDIRGPAIELLEAIEKAWE